MEFKREHIILLLILLIGSIVRMIKFGNPAVGTDVAAFSRLGKNFLESGREMTALNIKKFIDTQRTNQKNDHDLSDLISTEYMAAVKVMLEQVRVAQHDHWQKTSRQAALLWNRVIREKILSKGADNG